MKVLVLNPYFPTLGGGEKHMGYLCKFIENNYDSVEIDILVHNYNNIDINADDYPTIETFSDRFGIKLCHTKLKKLDLPKPGSLMEHYQNKKRIEKLSSGYDLFINFMYLSKHIGRAKRNIYSCMFPPQRSFHSGSLATRAVWRFLDFQFRRSYDYYLSNSLFTNHWLEYIWKTGKKNRIVYPPVFSEELLEKRASVNEERKDILLSVGRFFVGAHNKKQDWMIDFFIRNIERFKGWEYHLVGAVSSMEEDLKYIQGIQEKIKGYPIYLHLNCSLEELESLYREAKIFWHATGYMENDAEFPEKMEHFGITTVEAMSYGVVPVVINKGGQPEIVENEVNGYLWDDEQQLLELTLELMENNKQWEIVSKNCYKRADHFSIEKFYQKNKEIFDGISF
ncbi:glycosyltransferase family 4 protein [Paenibacillus beijingensis]|uniref:Glycosyl transferase family 1 domain-containing protein n=1 Tax=Paenibacillus beijingensis TaxID=1126833 RepID=A0A0D5NH44_9BACL|nr:glycosyltransferase [Paenibacillus beijingensis]AJY74601.1 hypothetical protein VN24_08460 [Paenibacillus beijingensis]